jgi:hypothetical protein
MRVTASPVESKTLQPEGIARNDSENLCFLASKGKALPLQAWTGPESSRSLKHPDFKTISTRRW